MAGRLTIIGGGVMGLMTAYHAAPLAESVTVLDRSRVGDPATASFGLTRSVRNDYLDPEYARLAFEARRLWREFERDCGRRLLIDCGCLNLVKASVTPDLASTYAVESYAVLEQLQLRREAFSGAQLRRAVPAVRRRRRMAGRGRRVRRSGRGDQGAARGPARPRRSGGREHRAARHHPVGRDLERGHRRRGRGIRRPGGHRGPGHQRRPRAGARLPGPVPAAARPPVAVQVLHSPGRVAGRVHRDGDAGVRLPGHRDLRAPDVRREDARRQDRFLQPARRGPGAEPDRERGRLRGRVHAGAARGRGGRRGRGQRRRHLLV